MSKKLFVGNLSFELDQGELEGYFNAIGDVSEVKMITDRETGRPRGFAFVTMASAEAADMAMMDAPHGLNGREIRGRKIVVNEAQERERSGGSAPRSSGGGHRSSDRGGRDSYSGGDRGGYRR